MNFAALMLIVFATRASVCTISNASVFSIDLLCNDGWLIRGTAKVRKALRGIRKSILGQNGEEFYHKSMGLGGCFLALLLAERNPSEK